MRRRALVVAAFGAVVPLVGCALIVDLHDDFEPPDTTADASHPRDATVTDASGPAHPNDAAPASDASVAPAKFDCTASGIGGWHTDCTFGNGGAYILSTAAFASPVIVTRSTSPSMYIGSSAGATGLETTVWALLSDGGDDVKAVYHASSGPPVDIGFVPVDALGDLVSVLTNLPQDDGGSVPEATFLAGANDSRVTALAFPILQPGPSVETGVKLVGFTTFPTNASGLLGSLFILTNLQMDGGPSVGTIEQVTVNQAGGGDASILRQASGAVVGQNDKLPDGGSLDAGDAGDAGDGDGDGAPFPPRIEVATAGANTPGGFWIVGHDVNGADGDAGASRFLGFTNAVQPPAQAIPFVPDDSTPILDTLVTLYVGRIDGQLVLGTLGVEQADQAPIQVLPIAPEQVPQKAHLQIPTTDTPNLMIYGLTSNGDLSILRFNFDAAGVATLDDSFGDGGVASVPIPYPAELGGVAILDSVYYASLRVHLPASEQGVLLRLSNQ